MAEVDRRIVEMRFENRQFEKNIAQSTKSVEELKEAMDFEETSKGLDKFSQAMEALKLDKLTENIQKLADKFTGLGTVTEYVMSRIRYSLESAAQSMEHFVKSLTIGQIEVGQAKYDQLNKAVMTIISGGKATEEEAYGEMERVMEYTKQTSHDFNTMVGQISGLTSIGKGLQESERLIEAIGNAATYAGGNAQQAAMSMSVLTKAFSSNYLGYEQFLQLSQTSRVITDKWREQALAAGEAVGTLKRENDKLYVNVGGQKAVEVTAKNLETTLRSRWLTGEALEKLYENYKFGDTLEELRHPDEALDSFGKTAYLTGQRALSLADAINAMKESVSGGWMSSFRLIFGDVTEAAEHFTNIADRVIETLEKFQDFRNGVLRSFAGVGGRTSLMKIFLGDYEEELGDGAIGFMDLLDRVGDIAYKGFVDFFALFANPDEKGLMKDDPQYFQAWLGLQLKKISDDVGNFMAKIQGFFDEKIDVNGKTKSRLEIIHETVQGIVGILKMGLDIISGLSHFGSLVGTNLTPSFNAIIGLIGDLGAEIYGTADATGQAGTIRKFFEDLATTLKPVTDGINAVVESVVKFLRLILGLDEESKKEGKTFETVSKILLTLANIVAKVAGPILDFVSTFIDLITALFTGEVTPEKFKEFGKNLGEAFKTLLRSLVDSLADGLGPVGNWIRDLFGLWEDETQGDSKSFFTFLRKVFTGGFSNFGEFLSQILGGFNLKTAIENGFGFGAAYNFLNTVIGWFKGTNLYAVIMAFLGVLTLTKLMSAVSHAKKAFKTVTAFFDDVGGNLKQGFTGEYEWFGERILRIAKAIGIFAAAVLILGSMDTGNMIQGILGLAAVMGLMFGLYYLLGKQKATMTQQMMTETIIISMAASIVLIAVAVGLMALALLPLASDPKKMITAVLGLAAILLAIGAFFKIMLEQLDKFTFSVGGGKQWSGIGKMAVMLLSLSAAVAILSLGISSLVLALTPLALTGWDGMLRAIIAFVAILAAFGVFIKLMLNVLDEMSFNMGGGKGQWNGIAKMAAMLLTLAASVALMAVGIGALVIAITPLSLMSWDGFARAMLGLGIVMIELGAMIKFIQTMSVGDKTVSLKIAGLAGFALGLGILILALTPLALMTWNAWLRAMLGLGLVLVMLYGMIRMISKMDTGDKGVSLKIAGLAGFAAALGILMLSLIPLAGMDWGGWARSMGGLALVLLMIIGFMVLFKNLGLSTKALHFEGIIGFAIGLWIIMQSLKPLADMSPQGYVQALVGMATVLVEMIVLMAVMKAMKPDLKQAVSTLLLLVGVGAAMILFGIAFNEVKDIPWQNMVAFAGGLSVLLLAIAFAGAIANVAGIQGMLILAAGLAAVIAVVALLAPLLIGAVVGSLTDAAGKLALIAGMFETFSDNMNRVDEGGISKGERIITQIKNLCASMIGFAFVSSSVESFGYAVGWLTIVSGELESLSDHAKNLKESIFSSFRSIISIIKDIIDNYIPSVTTTKIDDFAHAIGQMTIMSSEMATLSGHVADIKGSNFVSLRNMIVIITGIIDYYLPQTTGYGSNVDTFTQAIGQMTIMSSEMATLSGHVADIKGSNFVSLRNMIIIITGIIDNHLPTESGYGSNVDTFTGAVGQLTIMSSEMEELSKHMANVDTANIEKVRTTVQTLMGAMTTDLNGVDSIVGNSLLFSTAMYSLSTGIKIFSDNTGDITDNPDDNNAVKLIKALAGCAGDMDILAKMEISNLTSTLSGLGGAMILYAEGAKEATGLGKVDETTDVSGAVTLLKKITESLVAEGGFAIPTNMPDEDALGLFGAQLAALAAALIKFEQAGQGLGDGTEKALEVLTFFQDLKAKLVETEFKANLATAMSTFKDEEGNLTAAPNELETFGKNIQQLGISLGQFANSTTYVDEQTKEVKTFSYDNAIVALNALGELGNKLPTIGGIREWWNGTRVTLGSLAVDIEALGAALGDFHTKTTRMVEYNGTTHEEEFNYKNALDALQQFVGLDTEISKITIGGIRSWWNGTRVTLGSLAVDIEALGAALGDFHTKTTRMVEYNGTTHEEEFNYQNAMDALSQFVGLDERISEIKVGGIRSWWNGTRVTLGSLAVDIEALGSALNDFHSKTTTMDTVNNNPNLEFKYDNAIKALEDFVGLDERLAKIKIGGVADWFDGRETNLTDLAGQLEGVGVGIRDLSEKIMGDGTDKNPGFTMTEDKSRAIIGTMDAMITFMTSMQEKLPTIGGLTNILGTIWNGRKVDLGDISNQLQKLGPGLSELGKGLNDGSWSNITTVDTVFSALDSIIEVMMKLQQLNKQDAEFGTNYYGAFESLSTFAEQMTLGTEVIPKLAKFMVDMADELKEWSDSLEELEAIKKKMEIFKEFALGLSAFVSLGENAKFDWGHIGAKLTKDVATAIGTGTTDVVAAAAKMITDSYDGAVNAAAWSVLGESITLGIKAGVESKTESDLYPAVVAMMQEAYKRGKEAIDSNSPSKLFMELGEFMGEGTAIGLKKTTDDVGDNAGMMGEVALDKARDMIALISTVMAEEMDSNPTITPILDLSKVKEELAGMNGKNGYGVNLDTSVSAARASRMGTSAYADETAAKPDYSGIYDRMNQLGAQINEMGKSIKQLRIYLNTGALVGGVYDGVDTEIGRQSFYAGRNN